MIPLDRARLPEKVHANFTGSKKKEFETELLRNQRRIAQGEIEKHSFSSDRWKEAKKQLVAETGGKCAYCEAPTTHVAYGDVEHYRPKSEYWWLAYCYDNYLVSCQLCNQKFKKAKFPVKNTRMPGPVVEANTPDSDIYDMAGTIAPDSLDSVQVQQFEALHDDERPLLLNPYFDEPADFFAWLADGNKGEVELVPLPSNPDAQLFCDAAIEHYGLNRKELVDYRWGEYEKYWTFRAVANDPGTSTPLRERSRRMVEKMKLLDAPYAGMIRYFDGLPFTDLLPPP